MSRHEMMIPDSSLKIAFGVDHVTSTFVDIRDTSKDEDSEEYYVFSVNNQGVYITNGLTTRQQVFVDELNSRFESSRNRSIPYPNLGLSDVCEIAKAFGMPDGHEEFLSALGDVLD